MRWLLVGLLLAAAATTGCVQDLDTAESEDAPGASGDEAAWPPEDVSWDTSGDVSQPLEEGPYDVVGPETHVFEDADGTEIASAVWRPDVPEGTEVPVVLRVSPYYYGGVESISEGSTEEQFWLDGIVPHGIAYAHVAVRGTAGSGGCMEFFSMDEQRAVNRSVAYYGDLDWTNGKVGMWGISYEGTTPWIAAAFPNEHLETIVPLSGLTSIWEHAYRNGTPVAFAPGFHARYWADGWAMADRGPRDRVDNTACPEGFEGAAVNTYSTVTGEKSGSPATSDYWEVRDFRDRILENYDGSVFLVHGLQDWRVPPHMAFPFVNELNETGNRLKVLMGQWWHDLPDRASRGEHVRWDHAETLLRWFQHELTDASVATGPAVDVEDNLGNWRTEDRWPPEDVSWTTLHPGTSGLSPDETESGSVVLETPGNANDAVDQATPAGEDHPRPTEYRARLGPLDEPLRFAGAARLPITVVPSSPEGARLYAELSNVAEDGSRQVVAHGVMDLRFHQGGAESHQLTPGEPVTARMELFPADVVVPAGNQLELRVVNGVGYTPTRDRYAAIDNFVPHPTPTPVTLELGEGESLLELPTIERDVGDGTYPGQPGS